MKQKKEYSIQDVDDIQFRMSCGIGAVFAIHEAMGSGTLTAETHLDALYGAYDYLHILNDQLRQIVDEMCAKGKGGAA